MTELIAHDFELAYEGRFSAANLAMLNPTSGLLDHLLEALAPYQARLSDLRIETNSPDLTRAHVACNVFGLAGVVRIFPDRLEVRGANGPATEKLLEIAEAVIMSVGRARSTNPVALTQHGFALAVHCEPKGLTATELLGTFAASKRLNQEAPISSSISMTFGQRESRLSAFLGLEPSVQLAGGLFLRLVATYDAQLLGLRDAAAQAILLLAEIQNQVLDAGLSNVHFTAD